MAPLTEDQNALLRELRPFDEAWSDIETTLGNTRAEFKGWREATEWVRNRT
jgi:hypothetical protein